MDQTVGLIGALVVANWSAMGIALRCRDKIDESRNILWGISGAPPESREMVELILFSDIRLIGFSLVALFASVGSILFVVGLVTSGMIEGFGLPGFSAHIAVTALYLILGLGMIAGSVLTGVMAVKDYKTIAEIAFKQLDARISSKLND